MTSRQVTTVLLDLAVILLVAQVLGLAARRLGQAAVIGEILAGILVGPTLFHGVVARTVFPPDVRPFLTGLADVGVTLFMFLIGLELDRSLVRGQGRILGSVAASSLVVPFALGAAVSLVIARDHPLPFVLFMGTATAITAFPVLARILTDRDMRDTPVGALALGAAAIGDVLAWSMLALIVTLIGGAQWRVLFAVPLAFLAIVAVPRIRTANLAVILAGVLVSAALTEWMGLHFIFGAFLFGLLLPRTHAAEVESRVGAIATLLMPMYFVVAGLQVDLSHVGTAGLVDLALILVASVGGKFGGVYLAARAHHCRPRTAATLGVLMNTRGLTELVILTVGLQLGILTHTVYSLMVVMAVVTTVMAGPLLHVLHPPATEPEDPTPPGERADPTVARA
jgi:Kef-type K+ transport system membrane component KefB